MRKAMKLGIVLFSIFAVTHSPCARIAGSLGSVAAPAPPGSQADQLVVIYHGLNDSHSRSWAQMSRAGTVGVTYFQRSEGSEASGTLMYKTIAPDGSEALESVTAGTRLEKSVLLFDVQSRPHIFVAQSDDSDQVIVHYFRGKYGQWQSETIIHFHNEGGRFIYELSADAGPDASFHLLILKTRSDIDSDDYWDAWINSHLYHLTNATGAWEKQLIYNYDTAYTYDHQIKSSSRQDIKVDREGHVHVIFGEQVNGNHLPDPSRLRYATNKTGHWIIETALDPASGSRDEAGWLASLCLDRLDTPHIACMYKRRVTTGSAVYCKLLFLKRLGYDDWYSEVVATRDDGYFGPDGRRYTGALSHLVFDVNNTPHIIFSDVASAHWGIGGTNRLSIGNIRHASLEDGTWNITTRYRQPRPTGFRTGTEMYGMCLVMSEETGATYAIGQELVFASAEEYTCSLIELGWDETGPATPRGLSGSAIPEGLRLTWRANSEGDVSHYLLHRGYSEDFAPRIENRLAATTDTSLVDSTWVPDQATYYKLAVVDAHGNESSYSVLVPADIVIVVELERYETDVRECGIAVSWKLSLAPAVDFAVFRREGPAGEFRELDSVSISREDLSFTFVDHGCERGREYFYRVKIVEGNQSWTLFDTAGLSIPERVLRLHPNHPNPLHPGTTIVFESPEKTQVNLSVYGPQGQLTKTLFNGETADGRGETAWDGTGADGNGVSSGVYYLRLAAGSEVRMRKIVLVK